MDFIRTLLAGVIATALTASIVAAQDADAADQDRPAKAQPLGRLVVLGNPIDDREISRVKNAAVELKAQAEAEGREAVLVMTLPAGTSQFHSVLGLVERLTSSEMASIKTVCWVPESVTGYNAIVPFACREVIMHPDAELGDIGRGTALSDLERDFVAKVASRRGDVRRPKSLAVAMSDPAASLVQVDIEKPAKAVAGAVATERRLVLRGELEDMRTAGVVITDTRTISEAGSPLVLNADEATRLGVLLDHEAEEIDQVAAILELPREALRSADEEFVPTKVRKIPVSGNIDMLLSSFLSRQIQRAVADGADMIIFEVDSPGGLKFASQELADQIADLSDRGVRTVAWVPKMAISGAAIISLGCDQIIMAPDAKIGDAGAITMSSDGAFERVPEKVVSPFRVEMANLAERKGRPPAILMAMVDKDLEVIEVKHAVTGRTWYMTEEELHDTAGEWEKVRLVEESRKGDEAKGIDGLLLTADGVRANELKIAEPPAVDFEEVKQRLGIPADLTIKTVERTWVDDLVVVLNSSFITGLLFFLGILCIYVELHTMTGLFGIGSVLCFSLFFWSKMLGGTAGSLEVVLFLLGFGLVACEIFVIPGFGVAGVTGGLLIVGSLVMASQTFQGLSFEQSAAASGKTLGQLGGAILGVIVAGSLLSRVLPKVPLFADMVLAPPGTDLPNGSDVRLRPDLMDTSTVASRLSIGQAGRAVTTLRPSGKARIDGTMYEVTSEGGYVDAGAEIEVLEVDGRRVVVRALG